MKKTFGITRLEVFFSLKRSGFLIYYVILAAFTFLIVNVFGGAFPAVQISSDNLTVNAPSFINTMMGTISLLTTFVVSSFAGMGALRDYRYQSYQITFTYPVSRSQYVFGKFLGIYLTNMLLFTAPLVGYAIGCEMPWLVRSVFLPFSFSPYLHVYFQMLAVNIFALSAIFFVLGLLVRNVVINWVAIIVFYILYSLAKQYFGHADTKTLGILLDPYGLIGTLSVSVGEGAQEHNTKEVAVQGLYLWNRLLWIGIGTAFLLFAALRFRFGYQKVTLRLRSTKQATGAKNIPFPALAPAIAQPKFSLRFGDAFWLKTFWSQLKLECQLIFKSYYFYIFLATSVIFIYFSSKVVGKIFEAPTYPTTRQTLEVFTGTVHIFILLLIMVFSGESVWRDSQSRLTGITGSMPASRSARFGAKTLALYLIVLVMMVVVMLCGLIFQLSQGYNQYDMPLYLRYLFEYTGVTYLFYCLVAVALQSITNNRFQGYALFGLLYVFNAFFASSLLRFGVLIPGHAPKISYSDLTGFGNDFYPFFVFIFYWLAFALLLWRAGLVLFPQADGETYKDRLKRLKGNGWLQHRVSTWAIAGSFLALGCFIFYNTNILNSNPSAKEVNKIHASYEKQYAKLRKEPQLSVFSINGKVDLLTTAYEMQADIKLVLVNKTNVPVNNIYLNLPGHEHFTELSSNKSWTPLFADKENDFYGYHLATPVLPGDSIQLEYHFASKPKGFTDEGIDALVNNDGTFIISSRFIPGIGYAVGKELNGNTLRKQYGLPDKPYAPLMSDTAATMENQDRVWLQFTISTAKDQIAICPGYLLKQWNSGDRAYFTYKMDQPAMNLFNIQSGCYSVKTESFTPPTDSLHRPIQLSVYYHATHNYNIDLLMNAMKDAVTFYTETYGPYQYRQLRIIEFPGEHFAISFANTIGFSENMGFLADRREITKDSTYKEDKEAPADYAYWVTAHEVGHQWWAHEVIPANTEGEGFTSETMCQYSAIMLIKQKYGEAAARKFLEHYSFEYLTERGSETMEERPLETVLGQQYIYYAKGMCMMYALQNYLGEETVNHVLKDFVRDYAFKEKPSVTPDILVNRLKNAAPDSLKYLVSDCLEKIIVYNDKLKSATYKRDTATMDYAVELHIEGKKLQYDPKGKSKEVAMNDMIEIGVLNGEGKLVDAQKIRVRSGENTVRFITSRRPASLMLDPNFDLQEKEVNKDQRKIKVTEVN